MTKLDVIVDPQDDIATVRAIQRLADRQPSVLAINVPPGGPRSREISWAIMRNLGRDPHIPERRRTRRDDPQRTVAILLRAHEIRELVVLQAQHLRAETREELIGRSSSLGVSLTLVYGGANHPLDPTTTLHSFLRRLRSPPQDSTDAGQTSWPAVPLTHPLRFRYDCARLHAREDHYRRVIEVHRDATIRFSTWLTRNPAASRDSISEAARIVTASESVHQRIVRLNAAQLALLMHGRALPKLATLRALRLFEHPLDDRANERVRKLQRDPETLRSAWLLVAIASGLPSDFVHLIGPDQITANRVLGCAVPTELQQYFCALQLSGGWESAPQPWSPEPRSHTPPPTSYKDLPERLTATLATLLNEPRAIVSSRDTTRAVRDGLDGLRRQGIVLLVRGRYKLSQLARFGAYEYDYLPPLEMSDTATDVPPTAIGNSRSRA